MVRRFLWWVRKVRKWVVWRVEDESSSVVVESRGGGEV